MRRPWDPCPARRIGVAVPRWRRDRTPARRIGAGPAALVQTCAGAATPHAALARGVPRWCRPVVVARGGVMRCRGAAPRNSVISPSSASLKKRLPQQCLHEVPVLANERCHRRQLPTALLCGHGSPLWVLGRSPRSRPLSLHPDHPTPFPLARRKRFCTQVRTRLALMSSKFGPLGR